MSISLRLTAASAHAKLYPGHAFFAVQGPRYVPVSGSRHVTDPPSIRAQFSSSPPAKDDVEARGASGVVGHDSKDERQRVVILGSGWAGYVLSGKLNPRKYRPIVVSPRTYFVFTPLLNDTATGTLEFRNTLEPIRKRGSPVEYFQGWGTGVDFAKKTVTVEPSVLDPDVGHALTGDREGNKNLALTTGTLVPSFQLAYDHLVVCVGCYSQTFGTKGVRENALFLKDIGDARKIRRRVLELFDLAILPTTTESVKKNLLHFAVVGGGPTGMEFAANLSDLIDEDIKRLYPSLMKYIKVSLYDVAPKVLPMFDATLADYAVKKYQRQGIEIKTSHHIEELRRGFPDDPDSRDNQGRQLKGGCYTLRTREEGDVGIGMCVWSTGNMVNPFLRKGLSGVYEYPTASARLTSSTDSPNVEDDQWSVQRHAKSGAIVVDDHLRMLLKNNDDDKEAVMTDVFALGDNCVLASGALPATAQTANQQAIWLAKRLNKGDVEKQTFGFRNLGVMTYLGSSKAMLQGGSTDRDGKSKGIKGWVAFLLWRGAYLTMTLSWRNKLLVPIYWAIVRAFGRDISRF